jgi:hypothetical protein
VMATINVIGTYHSRLPLQRVGTLRSLDCRQQAFNEGDELRLLADLHPKEGTPEEFH